MELRGLANPLIVRLIEIQAQEGLSTRQFADQRLHVEPSTWSRARRGDTMMGKKLLDAALHAYPELSYLYVQVIHLSNTKNAQTDQAGREQPAAEAVA